MLMTFLLYTPKRFSIKFGWLRRYLYTHTRKGAKFLIKKGLEREGTPARSKGVGTVSIPLALLATSTT